MNAVGLSRNGLSKTFTAAAMALVSIYSGAAFANAPQYKPGELIVKYRNGAVRTKSFMDDLYEALGVRRVQRLRGMMRGVEQLTLQTANVEAAVAQLRNNPAVEYAQPNYILRALPTSNIAPSRPGVQTPCILPGVPFPPGCEDWDVPGEGGGGRPELADRPAEVNPPVADPDLGSAYGISKIGADQAWATHAGDSNFVVAIIDTGIDYNHEDLAYNVWRNPSASDQGDVVGYDFVHNDGLPFDDNMHGTHCAGVIGATGGNGVGISGVNQRVSIMALKFLSAQGSGDTASAIRAIDYAVSHGARVLSNSWGGGSGLQNRGLEDAINKAADAGVMFVAAAGNDSNDNDSNPTYPAAYRTPNMIAVAAVDQGDNLASFSNTGAESVHLAAPGVRIYSTVPGNRYNRLSGTSMACPHVAGAAALLWSAHPEWNYMQVKEKLLATVDRVGGLTGKVLTGGRLNVFRALTE